MAVSNSGSRASGSDERDAEARVEIQEVFRLLGKRWNGEIIASLLRRPARFRELSRDVPGITDGVLNERLRELTKGGLVERRLVEGDAALVHYQLTEAGEDFRVAFEELAAWFQRNKVIDTGTP